MPNTKEAAATEDFSEGTFIPMSPNAFGTVSDRRNRQLPATALESLYWQSLGWVHTPPFKRLHLERDDTAEVVRSQEIPDAMRSFLKKGFQPKVQVESKVPYGTFPRSVAVELERRIIKGQDLKSILERLGLDEFVIRPASVRFVDRMVTLKHEVARGIPMEPFLDLHLFDDDCFFETRSPEEWMSLGVSEGERRKPVPGTALVPNSSEETFDLEWQPVAIILYDSDKSMYLVRRECDFPQNGTDFDLSENPSDVYVHRIYLQFAAEGAEAFVSRLYAAVCSRHLVEESLRLCYYVECMPTERVSTWRHRDMDYILGVARRSRVLKPNLQWIREHQHTCMEEMQLEYRRAFNYETYRDVACHHPCLMSEYESGKHAAVRDTHRRGCKAVVDYSFEDRKMMFARQTFWSRPEAVRALHRVQEKVLCLKQMSLYRVPLGRIATVDEFESLQLAGLNQVKEYVHGEWIGDIVEAIVSNLRGCGKGSYDLDQRALHTYQYTKLSKLLKTVTFMMQDVIRYLVDGSLKAFADTFKDACRNLQDVEEDFKWTDSYSSGKWAPSKGQPVFEVPLEIKGMHLEFAVPLEKYRDVVVNLFEEGLNVTRGLPQLEKLIMRRMLYGGQLSLDTVAGFEKHVVAWREAVEQGMDRTLIAAAAYVRSYDEDLKPLKTDQINYVKHLARMKTSCDQLKRVVELHMLEKERLSDVVPVWMDIGPFRLATELIRNSAAKKHETLADAVLVHFYEKLRQLMEELNDQFLMLMDRIEQPTGNIEDLLDKKQWCRTVPKKIEKLSQDVEQLRSDYRLICTFHRNLDDDDFATYWRLLGLPHATSMLLDRRIERFEEEREQHRLHLSQDEKQLSQWFVELEERVDAFGRCWDREKAAVTANLVRIARKDCTKYEERSMLYNKRERLFGMPGKTYDQIDAVSAKLEPYESLWLSVADFYKYRERELTEQLAIDRQQLAAMLADFGKRLEKSAEFFGPQSHPEVNAMIADVLREMEDFRRTKLA